MTQESQAVSTQALKLILYDAEHCQSNAAHHQCYNQRPDDKLSVTMRSRRNQTDVLVHTEVKRIWIDSTQDFEYAVDPKYDSQSLG